MKSFIKTEALKIAALSTVFAALVAFNSGPAIGATAAAGGHDYPSSTCKCTYKDKKGKKHTDEKQTMAVPRNADACAVAKAALFNAGATGPNGEKPAADGTLPKICKWQNTTPSPRSSDIGDGSEDENEDEKYWEVIV